MNAGGVVLRTISLASPTLDDEIREALLSDGFFLLSHHGVDAASMIDAAKHFFASDAKREIPLRRFRGYSPFGAEVTTYNDRKKKRDWHEGWDFMPDSDDPLVGGRNQYGDDDRFEAAVKRFYDGCNAVGLRVIRAVERAIGLAPGGIVPLDAVPFSLLRLLHYVPAPEEAPPGGVNAHLEIGTGIGEHTDYGFLTLVFSHEQGLQVRSRIDNEWLTVPELGSCFVVNIGDALCNQTQGVLRATPHRVVVDGERVSVAFFCEPPLDMIVQPIRTDYLARHPQRDESMLAIPPYRYGDYLYSKYAQALPTSLDT